MLHHHHKRDRCYPRLSTDRRLKLTECYAYRTYGEGGTGPKPCQDQEATACRHLGLALKSARLQ